VTKLTSIKKLRAFMFYLQIENCKAELANQDDAAAKLNAYFVSLASGDAAQIKNTLDQVTPNISFLQINRDESILNFDEICRDRETFDKHFLRQTF